MAAIASQTINAGEQPLFTCLSCSVAFPSAEDQRIHYRSDFHRYNMKRRVASLPPVTAAVFNQKVLDRRAETAVTVSPKDTYCDVCSKAYTTENAFRSHVNSKKHKENEAKASSKPAIVRTDTIDEVESVRAGEQTASSSEIQGSTSSQRKEKAALTVNADATEAEILQTIDEKIAAARSKLSPTHCLFCPQTSESLDDNLTHMSSAHSFFIPDAEYLIDIIGLITYLGEKIAVGNVCIYCNTKSREFRSIEAVRKHMIDKSHCKIAYDNEKDRLEISDYYDFSSSYPDHDGRTKRKGKKVAKPPGGDEDEEWEDADDVDDEDVDEVLDEEASDVPESGSSDDDDDNDDGDSLPGDQLTYGDTPYELVLPSGARIGHRSLRRYYAQSFRSIPRSNTSDPNSGAAIVRRLLADKNSALVPVKGGFGAFGTGTEVVKARNRGEAREAGRHVREFRDQRRREEFKTKVGFVHNHQKHFRDPLLQ